MQLLARRQQADGVEKGPARELAVRTQLGGPDVHLPQLG